MKKSVVVVILLVTILLAAAPAFSAPKDDFSIFDKLMQADVTTRQQVGRFVRDNYPDLGKIVLDYFEKTNPEALSQMKAARAELIATKYPGLPAKLARRTLQDLTAKHPTILMDVAVDVSTMISKKYPMLPYEIMKWKSEEKTRSRMIRMLRKNHPELAKDFMEVISSGGYREKIKSLRSDVLEMMAQRHPDLRAKVTMEVLNVVNGKYPDLPAEIAEIRENPDVNPRFAIVKLVCSKYPTLIPEVLTAVRDKHGREVHQALLDVLELAENKYPALGTNLMRDMSAMTAKKHPGLMFDRAKLRFETRDKVAVLVRAKYPDLQKDIRGLVDSKYPQLRREIAESVDRNFPDLKKDVADLMKTRFEGVMTGVRQEITKKHPDFMEKISRMLK